MRVLMAFDSFKGTLSSVEAAEAARKGLLQALPQAESIILAVADGGEGMAQAVYLNGIGQEVKCRTVDPLGREIDACYTYHAESRTAYIDMAAASGLTLLAEEERNPWHTTSYGTGLMILHAFNRGARHICLGLGGTATNDAGLAALQALGLHILDRDDHMIHTPLTGGDMAKVGRVDTQTLNYRLRTVRFTLLCDVTNPFTGPEGAVAVFATQKGGTPALCRDLEAGMLHIRKVMKNGGGIDIFSQAGTGAAGGAAGSWASLCDATIVPGAEALLRMFDAPHLLEKCDLVLTGEGSADSQTLHGKLPFTVMRMATGRKVPTLLLAGRINDGQALRKAGFLSVSSINDIDGFAPGNPLDPTVASARLTETVRRLMSNIETPNHT